jgi:hypothetical protein
MAKAACIRFFFGTVTVHTFWVRLPIALAEPSFFALNL